MQRVESGRRDYDRRDSWRHSKCECVRARTCNGRGYRIPLSKYINRDDNATWYMSFSVPCRCTCNSDHVEANRYWVEILGMTPPEPFTPREQSPLQEEREERIDWAVYYHKEKQDKERYEEERGKLQERLPAAQIAANSGSATSTKKLRELQAEIDNAQPRIEYRQNR